jgi:hypothetical protein
MDSKLVELIKQVLMSKEVIIAAVFFLVFRELVIAAITPHKPKIKKNQIPKKAKIKRPPAEKPALDKNIDTDALDLGK